MALSFKHIQNKNSSPSNNFTTASSSMTIEPSAVPKPLEQPSNTEQQEQISFLKNIKAEYEAALIRHQKTITFKSADIQTPIIKQLKIDISVLENAITTLENPIQSTINLQEQFKLLLKIKNDYEEKLISHQKMITSKSADIQTPIIEELNNQITALTNIIQKLEMHSAVVAEECKQRAADEKLKNTQQKENQITRLKIAKIKEDINAQYNSITYILRQSEDTIQTFTNAYLKPEHDSLTAVNKLFQKFKNDLEDVENHISQLDNNLLKELITAKSQLDHMIAEVNNKCYFYANVLSARALRLAKLN